MSNSKISLYSVSDLKATLDDHVPLYLTSPNTPSSKPLARSQLFIQSHTTTYIRLGLGYSAVVIAAYIFYLDYILKIDFVETKTLTLYAVIAYFILNGAFTMWIWFSEKGLIFEGSRIVGNKKTELKIWSKAPGQKYEAVYCISALTTVGTKTLSIERRVPFTKFFTQDSYFVPEEFEDWLQTQLPEITSGTGKQAEATTISSKTTLTKEADTITVASTTVNKTAATSSSIPVDSPAKKRSKKKA